MKKILAALLTLVFLCTGAVAWAAPTRDMQTEDVDLAPGLQMLLETVLGAAVLSDTPALDDGAAPSAPLAQAALALGVKNLSLPVEGLDPSKDAVHLSAPALERAYSQLFAAGSFSMPQQPAVAGVSRTGENLTFDVDALGDAPLIGVRAYAFHEDNDGVEIMADLYAYESQEMGMSADDIPEEGLAWLRHANVHLSGASASGYGYVVRSFALSPLYQAGRVADWQEIENEEGGYSLNLPDNLTLTNSDPFHCLWQTADGAVQLRINVEDRKGRAVSQLVQEWKAAHGDLELSSQEEFGIYCALGQDTFQALVATDEAPNVYTLRIQFPAQRLEEYSLYSEFIINSMNVWGLSNG